jgi:superfamily II DNA or RNA helicase
MKRDRSLLLFPDAPTEPAMPPNLRPYQERTIRLIRMHITQGKKRILAVAPTGCHKIGQGILMFDGTVKAVEDIAPGELLMGPDGRSRTVLRLCRGHGRMVKIRPVKGEPWVVNEDHVLTLVRTSADGQPHRNGELIDVTVREWMSWPKWRKHIHKLFRAPADFPKRTDILPLDPYFLGIFLGDGCSMNGASHIASSDPEIQKAVRGQARKLGLRARLDLGRGITNQVLHVNSGIRGTGIRSKGVNKLRTALGSLGLLGVLGDDKFVPCSYKIADSRVRREVLAGLLDSDGNLTHDGCCYDFISKSRTLCSDVVFIARSLGLHASVKRSRKGCQTGAVGTYWRACISGETSRIPCRVARKKAFTRLQKKNVLRTGFSITRCGSNNYYGFTLDGDGRYMLGDFTVTHNSGKMVLTAAITQMSTVPVLFVCHRQELIEGCASQLARFGVTNFGVIRGNDERVNPSAVTQIGSIQTLARRDKPFLDVPQIIIFIDEAHRAGSDSYVEHIFRAYPNAIIIGWTATPTRLDNKPLGGELFEVLEVVATYGELLKHKDWLVEPIVISSGESIDLSHVRMSGHDFDDEDLGVVMRADKLEGRIVEHWLTHAHRHPVFDDKGVRVHKQFTEGERRRTFGFAVNVAHSMSIAERFEKIGVKVVHIDAKTPDDQRKAAVRDLGTGAIEMIWNCGIFWEGVDVPEAKLMISACPTFSMVRWRQSTGRIMRPWNNVVPVVLDHAGNWDRIGCPFEDLAWSLKDKPTRLRGRLPMKMCKQCFAYVEPGKSVCPHCGYVFTAADQALPAETSAELVERNAEPEELKRSFFSKQVALAKSKGFKAGFASAMFKEHYGRWPPREWSNLVKQEFSTDGAWQASLTRRLKRSEERKAQEAAENAAIDKMADEDPGLMDQLEGSIEAFDFTDWPEET